MLRRGIVALMITVMSVSGLHAADRPSSRTLMGFFRGPAIGRPNHQTSRKSSQRGVRHAVIADAARQVPEIRQTSNAPQQTQLQPAATAPQPMPVQYMPHASAGATVEGAPLPVDGGHYYAGPEGGIIEQSSPFGFASSSTTVGGTYGETVASGWNGAPGVSGPVPGAALYPAPVPGIPHQAGGTAIVHQAFHPHEMLYPHRYKAMYGPYYYKVHGGWIVTPFGVWSKENWKLKGTTVDVKYKSHISPLSGFHRPIIR